jgi:hypothetical protein
MTEKPSLLAYFDLYAAGGIPREEMIETVADWDFEEGDWEQGHIESSHQANTFHIVSRAALRGDITDEDLQEISRRRIARNG